MGLAKNTKKKLDGGFSAIGFPSPTQSGRLLTYQMVDEQSGGMIVTDVGFDTNASETYKSLVFKMFMWARVSDLDVGSTPEERLEFLVALGQNASGYSLNYSGGTLFDSDISAYLDEGEEALDELDKDNPFIMFTGRLSDNIERFLNSTSIVSLTTHEINRRENHDMPVYKNDVSGVFEVVGDFMGSHEPHFRSWINDINKAL